MQLNGVTCILVFDGARLTMKNKVEEERLKQRQQSLALAAELMRQGNVNEANKKFIEGIEINCDMIHLFIQELKHANVKYIVAPYESDAQLAFLYH